MKSETSAAILKKERSYFAHSKALVESDQIGHGTRIWAFAHVMGGVRIGSGCNIGEHTYLETGSAMGNNVTVKNGVAIWDGVTIEDNVFLGPNCVFTNDLNPRAYIKKERSALLSTCVHSNATIGANATILCGIQIGHYAFVGAGAVVTRSVPDFALIVGNPGRQVGWMCVCANRLPISDMQGASITCPHCGMNFTRNTEGQLILQRRLEMTP